MSQTKRAWKLQEFIAHASNVNCLAMGQKTGRVMATGGEDKKVNLWAAGKPNCVMSLGGHTNPVESVRFGHNEEMVVAGSTSGAMKIWDLEEAKILRTLTGHKSSVTSLEFHPYGDYSASGSLDSNIKLWDIRRKGCIYTYKGHTNAVNCLKFSPDGRWIASAGEDGMIKIWNITAGKLLTDMKLHTAAVNVVEFHPNEMLLASGSADRTVKFWDLESFQLLCSTEPDSGPIRCLYFHPDGTCLYAGLKDYLKVYGWEPAQCFDSVPMAWGDVADIASAHNQLIASSFNKTNVSTFVVDLSKIQPHGGVPHQEGGGAPLTSSHGRKSFLTERPPTQSTRQASVPKEDEDEPKSTSPDQEDRESSADIRDPEDYREIFQPKSRLDRSPTRLAEPFQPPIDDEPEPVRQTAPPSKPPSQQKTQKVKREPSQGKRQQEQQPTPAQDPPAPKPAPATAAAKAAPKDSPSTKPTKQTGYIQPIRRTPSPPMVQPEDFLPAQPKAGAGDSKNMTEMDSLEFITKGHDTMVTVLSSRGKSLQTVRVMWTSGNIKTAVDSAISMNDQSVIVDILNVLNAKSGLWNLDISASLLPHLKDLLASRFQEYVMIACDSLKIVLKNFGPVIKANIAAPPGYGVDISREERQRKCNMCYRTLMDIRTIVDKKTSLSGKVGDTFRQLLILLGTLD